MIKAQHFYMIRHGETEANAAKVMAGSLDSPLTERGVEQAHSVIDIIKSLSIKPKAIIHSQLSRARDTAMIINKALNVPMHEDTDFAELHAGDWEGVAYDQCPDILVDWVDPPGGERFEDFFERIKRGKNKAFKRHEGPVLIVCHGGVFRAFGKIYGLNMQGVKNCHLYEFEPNLNNHDFPWDAWDYSLENGVITRQEAKTYQAALEALRNDSGSSAAKIAS